MQELVGGGGGGNSTKDRDRIASRWIAQINAGDFTAANNTQLAHPKLVADIKRGKFDHLPGAIAARGGGVKPGVTYKPKPTRPGDIPLRTPVDKLPPVGGTMRRIAGVGALGGGMIGAASWALYAGTLIPTGWWRTAGDALGKYGASMGAQGTKGASFPKRVVPGTGTNRIMGPPPPPAGAPPRRAAAMPVGSSPSGTSAAPGVPAPAPATKGTPITLAAPPPRKSWWELALPVLSVLLKGNQTPKASKTIVNVGPFANPPQPSTDPGTGLDPLTPLEPGSACSCPTKKPAKPKKPRSECRTGRFIERFSGLQKYDTRRVQCRPSKKRLP
jgi:hypothetical protein